MTELNSKIIEVAEKSDFCLEDVEKQNGKYYVEMNNCTPCGEDWWETIWFDGTSKGFVNGVRYRADNFDVDEEAEVYINCRGENGVPSNIKDLIYDAEWKKSTLEELANNLENLDFEDNKVENEVEEINRIIDFLETDTYGLSDEAQNIIDVCIEKLECFKSDKGMNL